MPNVQIKLKRGTTAQWAASSTILASGEPGYDTELELFKIGNGVDLWDDLPDEDDRTAANITSGAATQAAFALRTTYLDTDYADLEAALTALPDYATLELRSTHTRTTAFVLSKPCTLRFAVGGKIKVTSDNTHGIDVTSDYVTIVNPVLEGDDRETLKSDGIRVKGASAANPIKHFAVFSTGRGLSRINKWSLYGVYLKHVQHFTIRDLDIDEIAYGAILGSSIFDFTITENRIDGVYRDGKLGSATLDFPSIAAGGYAELNIPVTGALTSGNDPGNILLTKPAGFADTYPELIARATVSTAGQVTVRLTNTSAAAIDPPSGAWSASVGLTLCYGIAVSNDATGSTPELDPISARGEITHNIVRNIPTWEGFDCHSGNDLTFAYNRAYRCKNAYVLGSNTNSAGQWDNTAQNLHVIENLADWGRPDGESGSGFTINGAPDSAFSTWQRLTGSMRGNVARNHGGQASPTSGGYFIKGTAGFQITGNRAERCAPYGYVFSYANSDATFADNIAVDSWSAESSVAGHTNVASENNTIKWGSGNVLRRGTHMHALKLNTRGLQIGGPTANLIIDGGIDFNDVAGLDSTPAPRTPIVTAHIAGSGSVDGVIKSVARGVSNAILMAGVVPVRGVWQRSGQLWSATAAPSASPGWVVTTTGGASSATWAATTAYTIGTWIRTAGGKVMECVLAGTSGGSEPTMTTIGELVVDGTVTWAYRSATSAVFKTMAALGA